jgi:hypothetical protein
MMTKDERRLTEVLHGMIVERQRLLIREANYLRGRIGLPPVRAAIPREQRLPRQGEERAIVLAESTPPCERLGAPPSRATAGRQLVLRKGGSATQYVEEGWALRLG